MNKSVLEKIFSTFQQQFGLAGNSFFCPGRINLMGDHIDYNGGWVLPAAISLGTYAMAKPNNLNKFRIFSCNFPDEPIEFQINEKELSTRLAGSWSAYVAGSILEVYHDTQAPLVGLDMVFMGDIPRGSGLSSSASLEVLVCYMVCHFNQIEINRTRLALWGQSAENGFVGMNCGIMDQFAVANGKENTALQLDCQKLDCIEIPVQLDQYQLVVINSCKPRKLVESKYNERRAESELALAGIQHKKNILNLASAELNDLALLENETIHKRARHVITENQRVLKSASALREKNWIQFGELLTQSHLSLKADYEVSGKEMDTLVELAISMDFCLGARMMGGGFGGCALALIEPSKMNQFQEFIAKNYALATGYQAEFYLPQLSNGVQFIS